MYQPSAPSTRVAECDEYPEPGSRIRRCWQRQFGADVFSSDGRYLGEVEFPAEVSVLALTNSYIRDDMLLTLALDDAGTIMVKRYRLVLPGEE